MMRPYQQQEYQIPPAGAFPGRRLPVREVDRFLREAMPVAAIAHSYHVEALSDPNLRANPLYQRFSLIELNELHHQIAAQGALLRHQMGDPRAAAQLGYNLAGFLQNRQAALELAPEFPPEIRQNPAQRRLMALTRLSNQQIARNRRLLEQVLAATGATGPGPMLVRCP